MLSFRTGLTQRADRSFSKTNWQTSGLASVRATHWITDRVRGGARLYTSSGRTSAGDGGVGGTGATLTTTYWPTNAVSVRGTVGVEQLRYDTVEEAVRDRIGRARVEVEWTLRPAITLFGRTEALYANLDRSGSSDTDLHVTGGLRIQLQRDLGGTSDPPPQRRVCRTTEDGLQVRVPYEGSGTLYVTGDLTDWSLPGVPLEKTDGDTWQTTLDLPAGRYAYRLRIVDGNEARWLDLPSYAQTTQDSFGSTNGVCIVH